MSIRSRSSVRAGRYLDLGAGEGTDKPDGPEPHNGLLYCYEGTNITGEMVVNDYKTQLNDALIAFHVRLNS